MPDRQEEKKIFRKYLLGEISSEAQREEVETRLMVDEKYFERLLVEEEELIQDYADGELGSGALLNFEQHFLISEERRQKVVFARTLRSYVNKQEKVSPKEISPAVKQAKQGAFALFVAKIFASPLPAAAAILIIGGLSAALIWNFILRSSPIELATAALNRAYKVQRPFEPRITNFEYAPAANTRGAEPNDKIDVRERNRAGRILLDEVTEHPSGENVHALARLYLAKKEFDEAIQALETAQKLLPGSAQILNDLGAAKLEKSKFTAPADGGKSSELAAEALENFRQAIKIDPALLEARFNEATNLQILKMTDQAKEAWREYLKLDGASPWAGEARRNLELLDVQRSEAIPAAELEKALLAALPSKT